MTVESFKEWKERFEEEMKKGKQKVETNTGGRLTGEQTPPSGCGFNPLLIKGRQMFERDVTLALSDVKFLTEDDMESGQGANVELGLQDEVEVDESLFESLEDLAIEDDS